MEPGTSITSPNTTPLSLIRCKKVCQRTGLSRSYVYQLAREGKFPKPIELIPGGSSVAWLEHEVEQWIEDRIAASRGH